VSGVAQHRAIAPRTNATHEDLTRRREGAKDEKQKKKTRAEFLMRHLISVATFAPSH